MNHTFSAKQKTAKQLRAELLKNNIKLIDWSRIHGFDFNTVVQVIKRHCNSKINPKGPITISILKKLSEMLDSGNE